MNAHDIAMLQSSPTGSEENDRLWFSLDGQDTTIISRKLEKKERDAKLNLFLYKPGPVTNRGHDTVSRRSAKRSEKPIRKRVQKIEQDLKALESYETHDPRPTKRARYGRLGRPSMHVFEQAGTGNPGFWTRFAAMAHTRNALEKDGIFGGDGVGLRKPLARKGKHTREEDGFALPLAQCVPLEVFMETSAFLGAPLGTTVKELLRAVVGSFSDEERRDFRIPQDVVVADKDRWHPDLSTIFESTEVDSDESGLFLPEPRPHRNLPWCSPVTGLLESGSKVSLSDAEASLRRGLFLQLSSANKLEDFKPICGPETLPEMNIFGLGYTPVQVLGFLAAGFRNHVYGSRTCWATLEGRLRVGFKMPEQFVSILPHVGPSSKPRSQELFHLGFTAVELVEKLAGGFEARVAGSRIIRERMNDRIIGGFKMPDEFVAEFMAAYDPQTLTHVSFEDIAHLSTSSTLHDGWGSPRQERPDRTTSAPPLMQSVDDGEFVGNSKCPTPTSSEFDPENEVVDFGKFSRFGSSTRDQKLEQVDPDEFDPSVLHESIEPNGDERSGVQQDATLSVDSSQHPSKLASPSTSPPPPSSGPGQSDSLLPSNAGESIIAQENPPVSHSTSSLAPAQNPRHTAGWRTSEAVFIPKRDNKSGTQWAERCQAERSAADRRRLAQLLKEQKLYRADDPNLPEGYFYKGRPSRDNASHATLPNNTAPAPVSTSTDAPQPTESAPPPAVKKSSSKRKRGEEDDGQSKPVKSMAPPPRPVKRARQASVASPAAATAGMDALSRKKEVALDKVYRPNADGMLETFIEGSTTVSPAAPTAGTNMWPTRKEMSHDKVYRPNADGMLETYIEDDLLVSSPPFKDGSTAPAEPAEDQAEQTLHMAKGVNDSLFSANCTTFFDRGEENESDSARAGEEGSTAPNSSHHSLFSDDEGITFWDRNASEADEARTDTDNAVERGIPQSSPPVITPEPKANEARAETVNTIETEVPQSLLPVTPPVVQAAVPAAPVTRTPLGPLSVNIAGGPKKQSEKAGKKRKADEDDTDSAVPRPGKKGKMSEDPEPIVKAETVAAGATLRRSGRIKAKQQENATSKIEPGKGIQKKTPTGELQSTKKPKQAKKGSATKSKKNVT